MKKPVRKHLTTSWEKVAEWYDRSVGTRGHYYHQNVILPNLLRLLRPTLGDRVLDIGCGQGVLGKQLGDNVFYLGVDLSSKLIDAAKKNDTHSNHRYLTADATKPLKIEGQFNKATMILSLQNMSQPFLVIKNISQKISNRGQLFIVINHPCFRIPQHSDWGFDQQTQEQYRKIYRYYQPLKIDIAASPYDKKNTASTRSFHYPLSTYVEMFKENGLVLTEMEEWLSPKISEGGRAKAENFARGQIPMFMMMVTQKVD